MEYKNKINEVKIYFDDLRKIYNLHLTFRK